MFALQKYLYKLAEETGENKPQSFDFGSAGMGLLGGEAFTAAGSSTGVFGAHKLMDLMTPQSEDISSKTLTELGEALGVRGKVNVNIAKGVSGKGNAYFSPRLNEIRLYGKSAQNPGALAHELGHAQIHHGDGRIAKFIQQRLIGLNRGPFSRGLASLGAAAVGQNEDDPVKGMLKGVGIGAAIGAPTLINEADASRRAIKAILKSTLPTKNKIISIMSLIPAYGSYALLHAGVPGAVGGASAWWHKRKKEKELQNK
jgi:hypothetical protein